MKYVFFLHCLVKVQVNVACYKINWEKFFYNTLSSLQVFNVNGLIQPNVSTLIKIHLFRLGYVEHEKALKLYFKINYNDWKTLMDVFSL